MSAHIVDLLRRDFIDYQKMDFRSIDLNCFSFYSSFLFFQHLMLLPKIKIMLRLNLLNRVACMLACGRGLRAHVPKASQLLIFTCQRCVPIFQFGVPFNFSTSPAKARANFLTIFQNNFSILNFSIILNIWKFQ